MTCWTNHFPKDLLPIITPLSRSCIAPATISDADAVLPFISNTRGISLVIRGSSLAKNFFSESLLFPRVVNNRLFLFTNLFTIPIAASSSQPPLSRKSKITPLKVFLDLNVLKVLSTSFSAFIVNRSSFKYAIPSSGLPINPE